MLRKVNLVNVFLTAMMVCCLISCKENQAAKEKEIVKTPEEMDDEVADNIKTVLDYAKDHNGNINDSITLSLYGLVSTYYEQNNFKSIWSSKENWNPLADSMYHFIENSKYYGLYPQDYHFKELDTLRKQIINDSLARMDAITWTRADLMLSDAFMKIMKDLKEGRLLADSVSIISKKKNIDSFFVKNLNDLNKTNSISTFFNSLEPSNANYQSLRKELTGFVDKMDTTTYLYINYPYKDSLIFIKNLNERLAQSGFGNASVQYPDSATLYKEIKKYQKEHHLKVDGKAGPQLVKSINSTDNEKFKNIAITLDRYKLLPPLPESYIWVNIPGFYLQVLDHDSLIIESKVIVGKPSTPTPVLTSEITDMVTFPQWTIPQSIIKKDILPQLKKDPGYLERKGFSLVDFKGETVNPFTINWSGYKKGIPWKVVQGSGDDNALGIFKFNFNNRYSVYLHDTNQRYLFGNDNRALSHGCVRVQKWEALAFYIAHSDSMAMDEGHPISYTTDSIKTWLDNKSRKRIMIKKRLPLFIEYFTCVTQKDKIVFYDDIYNEDKFLAQKYFAKK
jgi:murein L,D-transpeptidase YcbB/YkuD